MTLSVTLTRPKLTQTKGVIRMISFRSRAWLLAALSSLRRLQYSIKPTELFLFLFIFFLYLPIAFPAIALAHTQDRQRIKMPPSRHRNKEARNQRAPAQMQGCM
jgi:hypothetical protein